MNHEKFSDTSYFLAICFTHFFHFCNWCGIAIGAELQSVQCGVAIGEWVPFCHTPLTMVNYSDNVGLALSQNPTWCVRDIPNFYWKLWQKISQTTPSSSMLLLIPSYVKISYLSSVLIFIREERLPTPVYRIYDYKSSIQKTWPSFLQHSLHCPSVMKIQFIDIDQCVECIIVAIVGTGKELKVGKSETTSNSFL